MILIYTWLDQRPSVIILIRWRQKNLVVTRLRKNVTSYHILSDNTRKIDVSIKSLDLSSIKKNSEKKIAERWGGCIFTDFKLHFNFKLYFCYKMLLSFVKITLFWQTEEYHHSESSWLLSKVLTVLTQFLRRNF